MSCYLCKSDKYSKRTGSVRDNPDINVLECSDCGLVYLSSLEHIQDKHYEASGMHDDEVPNIDKWLKETEFDDKRRYDFVKEKIANKNVLDFGCGVGGFLEMAKQSASNISGIELERALQHSFQERKLNVLSNLKEAQKESKKYNIITAFHVVEHLKNPKKILKDLSRLLTENGEMIIEVPNSNDVLLTLYENEAFRCLSR